MKVVVTDYSENELEWESRQLASRGIEFAYYQLRGAPFEQIAAATEDADIVVVNMVPVTAALVAGWRKCRLVIRHGTGYDMVDVAALAAAGISFCYVPDYCTEEVAEHAIAMILACGRRLTSARRALEESARMGRWDFSHLSSMRCLAGQTVGIIGCGRIGSRVYEKLRSFGFQFLICDPYLPEDRKRELGINVIPREAVFRDSDFVTLHTPLTSETRHMVNSESLRLMKKSAFLVNTARGAVVDTCALAEALRNGSIAGAAIDVYEKEPPACDDPLFGLPNALLTPHSAWYSQDSARRIRELIILEIDRFQAGLPPRHRVV